MVEPLALVIYPRILPGSQLVNRLQELNYRVETISHRENLVEKVQSSKPLIVIIDLDSDAKSTLAAIRELRENASTSHIAIIGVTGKDLSGSEKVEAGPSLVVSESAILNHLSQCLERALEL